MTRLLRNTLLTAVAACVFASAALAARRAQAQATSVSAWDAAHFRSWSFVPYWTSQSQLTSFGTDRVYDHLSDVLYFSGVQPRADGSLYYLSDATNHLATLKSQQAQFGFRYHMSMFDVPREVYINGVLETSGQAVERVWTSITSNSTVRATFVNNVKTLLTNNNMTGLNLDWERPDTVEEWGNYTQLAKDMQAAFPASWEVSVDDYGFASGLWDDSPVFDANAYDQIGMMGYHYPANNGTSLDQQSFADGKKALTGQGAAKAFKDSQIIIGMGTWGDDDDPQQPLASLKQIVAANPSLPADASSFTGTISGFTGTWDIVSRYEARDNVQLALTRGMAGVMFWALNYDATNKMSLARVAQHYAMFKKEAPDLTLDGKINAADANALADNMGTTTVVTGTTTPAQFESFYQNGNWEKGDHDGNGLVNQADADWLKTRYATLGVAVPDRLAYSGTFEKFSAGGGLSDRWTAQGPTRTQAAETGNFTQHNTGYLSFSASGPGAGKYSNSFVTVRNQNATEAASSANNLPRIMCSSLASSINLGEEGDAFFTFLVRQNTAQLSAAQLASANRTLAFELLDASANPQFDFALFGQQTDFGIRSQMDATGQDVSADGFAADVTYLFVGKISGHGAEANTMQASLIPSGQAVPNFSDPAFPWMLTAQSSAEFNPVITQVQFTSQADANYTISNVWIGSESQFFAPPAPGDFNADSAINENDLAEWAGGLGMIGDATHWYGDADGDQDADGFDFLIWQRQASAVATDAVPEPATAAPLLLALLATRSWRSSGRRR